MKCIPIAIVLFFYHFLGSAQKADSIQLANATLYYYSYGNGEPIILLSGGPGVSSHQEDDLANHLSKSYQAILFDQRGTGKSWTNPLDSTTINLKTAIDDIEVLRKHLKIKKLNLSGHSWGGILASAYAAKYPNQVNLLILIGPGEIDFNLSPIIDNNIKARIQLSDSNTGNYWSDSVNIKEDPEKHKIEMTKLFWYPLIYDRNKIDSVCQQAKHGTFNKQMSKLMWQDIENSKFNITIPLRSYTQPALILYGWQDPIASLTIYSFIKALPQAKIVGLNECGHMPSVEASTEFYKAIDSFLFKYMRKM